MEIILKQEVLRKILENGAVAALSDEAQSDTSNISPLVKSVKISSDVDSQKIVVESVSSLVASHYEINAGNDVTIKQSGSIVVPAKELLGWINLQKNFVISLKLSKLDTPELITTASDITEHDMSKHSIRKIGNVEIKAKDQNTKTGNAWLLDCYDEDQMPKVDHAIAFPSILTVKAETMSMALKKISFAAGLKDYEHVLDTVSFQMYNNDVYCASSDRLRCAIYKLDGASMDIANVPSDKSPQLLVPIRFTTVVTKLVDPNENIVFSCDKDNNRIFIKQNGLSLRVATTDPNFVGKFPPIKMLIDKSHYKLCTVTKAMLSNRINTASLVSKEDAFFEFANDMLKIKAKSEGGLSPNVSVVPVKDLKGEYRVVWSTKHVDDLIKVVEDSELDILVPTDDKKNWQCRSTDDDKFMFFAMSVRNRKYDTEMNES